MSRKYVMCPGYKWIQISENKTPADTPIHDLMTILRFCWARSEFLLIVGIFPTKVKLSHTL